MGLLITLVGLLAGTSQAQSQRDYTYDALGNRVAATNQVRFTAADAFSIQPRRALVGDAVNIYGRNFPFAAPGTVAVTVAGQAAAITSVAPNVISFTMPTVVSGGQVIVTIAGGTPLVAGVLEFEGITIAPQTVAVDYGDQVQYSAQVTGGSQTVTWKVNGVAGGNASVGTISSTGLYTAPAGAAAAEFPFVVSATSSRIDSVAYALVTPLCSGSSTIQPGVILDGSFAAPFERDCYDFNAQAGDEYFVAYFGQSTASKLRIRDPDGFTLGVVSNGGVLQLGPLTVTETGSFRVEVEATASSTGDYKLWLIKDGALPRGVWVFPGSGSWSEAAKWSGGVVPTSDDDVRILPLPGSVVVTHSAGTSRCSTLDCSEQLTVSGGALTVRGQVHSETLAVSGGALTALNQLSASSLTVSGGTLAVDGGARVSVSYSQSGGAVVGSGELALAGSVAWSGGSMGGTGKTTIANTGVVTITGGVTVARTFENGGTTTFAGGNVGSWVLSSAVFRNLPGGVYNHNNTFSHGISASGSGSAFENQGTFNKVGTAGAPLNVPLNNAGSLNVSAGTLTLASFVQASANAVVALGGGSISAPSGLSVAQGSLRGFGTITGNVTNNGTLEPGIGGAGTLTITGTYTQGASGVMNVEIGGTAQGAQFDRLTVSGAATLGGTLNIQLINGFQPTSGSFAILGHASRTGTFATVNGTTIGNGFSFAPNYTSNTQTALDVQ
ncbi:MAG: IPT/TIG domain-containing protein [Planctomycetes bacterium]|nr:IPT/TIG domain-containing protein [Planctomycetota bacterium]